MNRGGTWISAGFEYAKGRPPILRLKSRLLDPNLAKLACETNNKRKFFSTPTTKEYEESFKEAEKQKATEPTKRTVMTLPSRSILEISDVANSDITDFLFKDQVSPYFGFLDSRIRIYIIPVNADVNTSAQFFISILLVLK